MKIEELKQESSKIGVILTDEMLSQFDRYLSLLSSWNEKFNLTAIKDKDEMVEKHLFDCIIASSFLDLKNKRVADLGSGAGFPGLVFAILEPSMKMTLIDATKKKCVFLEETAKQLGLENVTVLHARAEELTSYRSSFDLITARAVAELRILEELASPLIKMGGELLAMKGLKGEEELKNAENASRKLGLNTKQVFKNALPGCEETRINIILRKDKETPNRYPRPYAEILKKPL